MKGKKTAPVSDKIGIDTSLPRRRFFKFAGSLTGGMFFNNIFHWSTACSQTPQPTVRAAGERTSLWVTPPAVRWSDKDSRELRVQLTINYEDFTILPTDGKYPVRLMCYNNSIVGPTLRVKPGDTLLVDLMNNLPKIPDPVGVGHNGPHGLYITNLHTHGLHVDPNDGDNVYLEIGRDAPDGQHKRLRYELPQDHPAGTYWYHAHKHGSVAVQVGNGMAGALIVEGGVDDFLKQKGIEERIFVFQQIPFREVLSEKAYMVDWQAVTNPVNNRYTLINGTLKPEIRLARGQVERWRFIHAGISENLKIELEGHQLYVIAHDGITTGRIEPVSFVELHPGYRVDVLVQAQDQPGVFKLQDLPERALRGGTEQPQELAWVLIGSAQVESQLPTEDELKSYNPFKDDDLRKEANPRRLQLTFDIGVNSFFVCGKPYDHKAPPLELPLDKVDEWVITTLNTTNGGNHPFHIHVNPFQVIKIGDKPLAQPIWKDTILVKNGEPVTFRMRYRKYTGKTVLHCHILDHEDQGMMLDLEIKDGPVKDFRC